MRTILCGMALSAVIVAPAVAETPYDRNLEKAVMGIVAGKIAGIRGGFSYVVVPDAASTASVPAEHPRKQASGNSKGGLAPAVARQVSRTTF